MPKKMDISNSIKKPVIEFPIATSNPSLLTNQSFEIITTNKAFGKKLLYRSLDIIGKPLNLFLPRFSSITKEIKSHFKKKTNKKFVFEFRASKKDGKTFPIKIFLSKTTYRGKTAYLIVVQDKTDVLHSRKPRGVQPLLNNSKLIPRKKEKVINRDLKLLIKAQTREIKKLNRELRKKIIDHDAMDHFRRATEEELQAIYDGLFDGLIVADIASTKFVRVNTIMCNMLGYTESELLHMSVYDIHPADQLDHVLEKFRAATEQHFSTVERIPCLRKDGTVFYADVVTNQIVYHENHSLVGLFRDISERIKNEQVVRNLLNAVEHAADCVIITDTSGKIQYVNNAFEYTTGYVKEEVLGKTPNILKSGKHDDAFYKELWLTILSGHVYRGEFINKKKNGELFVDDRTIAPVMDVNGIISHFVSTGRDVSEKKNVEEKLKESENKYRDVTKNVPGIVYQYVRHKDHSFSVPFISGNTLELYGLTPQEIISDPVKIFTVIHPDDIEAFNKAIDESAINLSTWTHEFRVKAPNNKFRWIRGSSSPRLFQNGDIVWHGVAIDITEQKRAEEALEQNRLWMESIYNALEEAVLVVNLNRELINVNKAAERIFGYSFNELKGQSTEVLHVDHIHFLEFGQRINKEFEQDKTANFEFKARRKNGEEFPSEHTVSLLKNEQGEKLGIVSVIRDITERKRAEAALHEAELRYRKLFQQSPDSIVIIDPETTILVEFNDAACRQLGYSREEFTNQHISDFEAVETPEETQLHVQQLMRDGQITFETMHRTKLTEIRNVVVMGHLIDLDGKKFIQAVFHDITEHKRAETALKYERDFATRLIDAAPVIILLLDTQGFILHANPFFEKLTGYRLNEVKGKDWFDTCIPQTQQDNIKEVFSRVLLEESDLHYQNPIITKGGAERIIAWANIQVKDAAGNKSGTLSFGEDITERKLAEEALAERERRYSALFNLSASGILLEDTEGNIVEVNDAFCNSLGYTREELIGKNARMITSPEHIPVIENHITLLRSGKLLEHVVQNVRKDGTLCWMELHETLITQADGRQGFLVIAHDITERKLAERELQEAEQRFRSIVEATPSALIIVEKFGTIILVNERAEHLFGYTREELVGKPLDLLLPERFRTNHLKHMSDYFTKPVARQMCPERELFGLQENGKEVPIEIVLMPLRIGNEVVALASIIDITLRKKAEQVIRDSEITLNRAQAVAHMGSWRLDVQQNILSWSRETYNIFGIPDEESLTYDSFLAYVHPDDRNFVDRSWQAALQGAPYDIEHRIVVKEEIKWVRERAELEMDASGALQHGIGTVQDITERKLAEETIKASLKEKELLLKEIHHRVKNNLQIVSSLLYLQSTKTEDEPTKTTFLESLNRIKSMALLHEELYQTGDLQRINFAEYLHGFISILKESYMIPDSPIDIQIENNDDKIDFDQAIYCGLIVNELVSNSLKYAFPGNTRGKIEIGLVKKENRYLLTVSDNGIGIKDMAELRSKKSMGLLIVERLVDQLNGTMEHQTARGATFIIQFEEKAP